MIGLLNIDKPAGITSRDVVNRVQRIARPDKVGHAGTLDPLATGVLVVCVGPATRLIEYIQRMPKRYVGTFLLGHESDTEDIEGRVIELPAAPRPDRAELKRVLMQFVGEIEQRPPAYSALKVRGKRAYELARKGETVELAARTIFVYDMQLLRYEYPEFVIDVTCGSGTYVRSLGRDIARSLGTVAVMAGLERTRIGDFQVADACNYGQISRDTIKQRLLPPALAVAQLPSIVVAEAEAARLRNGQTIPNRFHMAEQEIAAFDAQDNLVAVVAAQNGQKLRPLRTFPIK